MNKEVVSYLRCSTIRQGVSGLGLDAQRAAVAAFCRANGATIAREFQEVESGKNNDRAVLRAAIAYAKRIKAVLCIGKLDRLARNVAFIANLMDGGVEFVACDLPEASRLVLHIMASVAENEGRAISERTVAALASAKARGTALGASNPKSRNLTAAHMATGRALAIKARQEQARDFYSDVQPSILALRAKGLSHAKIAECLNAEGFTLRSELPFSAVQVGRLLARAA